MDALRHAGGPNSIDNFARSWTRAAGYFEITPTQTYLLTDEGGVVADIEGVIDPFTSAFDENVDDDQEDNIEDNDRTDFSTERTHMIERRSFAGSFNYGSLGSIQHNIAVSRLNDGALRHSASIFQDQELADDLKDREPLLVKRVEGEDGKVGAVIVGQSTLPQTVFNSVNVLVGVGLLSLPLGLRYSGWCVP